MKDDFFLTPEQLALLSAALRHVRDAERLLADSPDQTYHLAGFGPECARKAVLDFRWADKAIGHELAADLVDYLAGLDPWALRYLSPMPAGFQQWEPQVRYKKTGFKSRSEAEQLLQGCQSATHSLLTKLWADGRIKANSLAIEGF